MDGALLQLGGSLVAILVLAAIAWALGLGRGPEIEDSEDAMRLAREADSSFVPCEAHVAEGGDGAILADGQGRIMVLRRHGAHFAARMLERGATARIEGSDLVVSPADPRFGQVTLAIGDKAHTWAARIDALNDDQHA